MNQDKLFDHQNDYYAEEYVQQILSSTKSIALVGASDKPHRASYQVMDFLLNEGYHVFPVNPKLAKTKLLDQICYAELNAIPNSIDLVDIFRASEACYEIVQDAIQIQAKTVWMQLGVISIEAAHLAENSGMNVVMNRCPKIEFKK